MSVFYGILRLVWFVVLTGVLILECAFVFQFLRMLYRCRVGTGVRSALVFLKLWIFFKNTRFIFPAEFLKWVVIDIVRGKIYNRLFGIWCFTGYFGEGKSLGAVNYALRLRKQYAAMGVYVHIYTNFSMVEQDGRIEKWEDLLDLPKYTIVIFDEIQSTFTSQKFKDFPIDLLWKLTQCRKQQLCVFASSPVYSRMAIQLRENCDLVVTCSNILKLDRWFRYCFYRAPEYERFQDQPLNLIRKRLRTYNLIPADLDYGAYDTSETVDRFDISGDEPKKMSVNEKARLRDEIVKDVARRYGLREIV